MLITLTLLLLLLLILYSFQPVNERDWSPDQAVLTYAETEGSLVHIKNIRRFSYRSEFEYDVSYVDKTIDVNAIKSVHFLVVPFVECQLGAHSFVSFGFEDDVYISVSIEIRKKKGESFSILKGLFRQYEIMYIFGDELDLIKLRTHFRKDKVHLYPIKTPVEKIRAMFLAMIERTNQLKEKPEFYNTLTNNCTTNLITHVNDIAPRHIPLSPKNLVPGYADEIAYDLEMIDTELPWDKVRDYYNISERALKYDGKGSFSSWIRQRPDDNFSD